MSLQRIPDRFRRDGWTPARQLRFLDTLARTRSVTRAAAAAGMSRESAYRRRKRDPGGLFATAWDRVLEAPAPPARNGHRRSRPTAWRQAVKDAGFATFSTKGHEMYEPPIPRLPSCAAGEDPKRKAEIESGPREAESPASKEVREALEDADPARITGELGSAEEQMTRMLATLDELDRRQRP